MSFFYLLDTSFNQIQQKEEFMVGFDENKLQHQNIEEIRIRILMAIQNCLMRNIQCQSLIESMLEDLIPKLNAILKNYSEQNEFIQQPIQNILKYDIQTPLQNQLLDQYYYEFEEPKIELQISTQQISSIKNMPENEKQKKKSRNQKRGPYKKFTQQQKEDLIKQIDSDEFKIDATINKINIRRWQKFGTNKKPASGRKPIDSKLQQNLYDWCLQEVLKIGRPVNRDMIKLKALEFNSQNQKFKASKGWIDNFVKKFDLKQQMHLQIQQMGVYDKVRKQKNKIKKDQQRIEQKQNSNKSEIEVFNPSLFFEDDYFL